MSDSATGFATALDRAHEHASAWLRSVPERPVAATATYEQMLRAFRVGLPDGPVDAGRVVDDLAVTAEPGLTAFQSGRFHGFVVGGTLPAAMGADWLVSAWDQNTGLVAVTPAVVAAETVAGEWVVDLLGLPAGSSVGFVTGGCMANFTCLAVARSHVLAAAGWDVQAHGPAGRPAAARGPVRRTARDRRLGAALPRVWATRPPGWCRTDAQGRVDAGRPRGRAGRGRGSPDRGVAGRPAT